MLNDSFAFCSAGKSIFCNAFVVSSIWKSVVKKTSTTNKLTSFGDKHSDYTERKNMKKLPKMHEPYSDEVWLKSNSKCSNTIMKNHKKIKVTILSLVTECIQIFKVNKRTKQKWMKKIILNVNIEKIMLVKTE